MNQCCRPIQKPWPPLQVGGESPAALRRAARQADGWIGLGHTPESVRAPVAALTELRERSETADGHFWVTVGGEVGGREGLARWRDAGVDRLIVSPWQRSRDAADALRRLADEVLR